MSNHLSIELSKRLNELGAFEGREWQMGDWVESEEWADASWMLDEPALGYLEKHPLRCILLPRLDDVLEEFQKHVPEWRIMGEDTFQRIVTHMFYVSARDEDDAPYMAEGDNLLEAAASCLLAVLEGRE